jgi:hypothetical protein
VRREASFQLRFRRQHVFPLRPPIFQGSTRSILSTAPLPGTVDPTR